MKTCLTLYPGILLLLSTVLTGCSTDTADAPATGDAEPSPADVERMEPQARSEIEEADPDAAVEQQLDFESFKSFQALSDSDQKAVREYVLVLYETDPIWRQLDSDLKTSNDSSTLAVSINEYCDGVEKWKPQFMRVQEAYPQAVPGDQLDLIIQEIAASVMVDPRPIMDALSQKLSVYGEDEAVKSALMRLEAIQTSVAD